MPSVIIDPKALDAALVARGWTITDLSKEASMSRNTLQKAAQGGPVRESVVDRIASKLRTDRATLCGQPPSDAKRRKALADAGLHELRISLSASNLLNLELTAHRYNVTPHSIFEHAPLFFVLAAERSLRERQEALEKLHDLSSALSNFEHVLDVDAARGRLNDVQWAEDRSINSRDLHGRLLGDGAGDPFAAQIKKLLRAFGISDEEDDEDEPSQVWDRNMFRDDLDAIVGGDRRARYALERRYARLTDIPKSLAWQAEQAPEIAAARRDWLAAKVPNEAWEAYERYLDQIGIEFGLGELANA